MSSKAVVGTVLARLSDATGALGTATNPISADTRGDATSGFAPNPTNSPTGEKSTALFDASGQLAVRGQVITDEGSFSDDFVAALTMAGTGNATFTNGDTLVIGVGTSFVAEVGYRQYVRLSADGEADFAAVAQIVSDTELVLSTPYAGVGGTGVFTISTWKTTTPAGGSISVATSEVTLAPGTAVGVVAIEKEGDFPPFVVRFLGRISQRIANQVTRFGFADDITTPVVQAVFQLDGTSNTTVKCVSSSATGAANTETTTVDLTTIALTLTTAQDLTYEVYVSALETIFSVNGEEVARHERHTPGPYDVMNPFMRVENTAIVTATTLTFDYARWVNIDQLDVKTSSKAGVRTVQGEPNPLLANAWPMKLATQYGDNVLVGTHGRLTAGQVTLVFAESVDGSVIDLNRWVQSQSGMTQVQGSSILTLNAGSSLTSGNYSILTSANQLFFSDQWMNFQEWKARVIARPNALVQFGVGAPATTAAVTDGAYFEFDGTTAVVKLAFAGVTTSATFAGALNSTSYYQCAIRVRNNFVAFRITSQDDLLDEEVLVRVPSANPAPFSASHLPLFQRVLNSALVTGPAAQLLVGSVTAASVDVARNEPWTDQIAVIGRGAVVDPAAGTQVANFANSAAPASATLSNTAAGYTTLGGLFQFAAVAGAETDYALFAFQVPSPFKLLVKSVSIHAACLGANTSGGTPTVFQWALAANSSAVSLATGAPNPPIRIPLGMQSTSFQNTAAGLNELLYPGSVSWHGPTPLVVYPGRFFHIILRMPQGLATGGLIFRGTAVVNGHFE